MTELPSDDASLDVVGVIVSTDVGDEDAYALATMYQYDSDGDLNVFRGQRMIASYPKGRWWRVRSSYTEPQAIDQATI